MTFEWPPDFYSLELKSGGSLAIAQVPDPVVGGFQLCVYTDNVDAAVASLRDSGVTVLQEPEDQPWNERMAYVADPDGRCRASPWRIRGVGGPPGKLDFGHWFMLCERLGTPTAGTTKTA